MNYYFVTGSSKGLGEAIVKELLNSPENHVYGLSRQNPFSLQNFKFIELDLSNNELVEDFTFPKIQNISSVNLINNAGIIGDIKPVGKKSNKYIGEMFQINLTAPSILTNQFIKQFQDIDCQKTILNISSGAGRHTINSWADYCASKAALDMFSQVVYEEQKQKAFPIHIFSVAPGIIDTNMQTEIRSAKKEDFEQLDYFIQLKKEGTLSSPQEVSEKLISILNSPHEYLNTLLDVRDL